MVENVRIWTVIGHSAIVGVLPDLIGSYFNLSRAESRAEQVLRDQFGPDVLIEWTSQDLHLIDSTSAAPRHHVINTIPGGRRLARVRADENAVPYAGRVEVRASTLHKEAGK
jgi:hypothetical protein